MKVLVTGGAGYIGSHTVKSLVKHGHEVWVFDSLEHGDRTCVEQFIPASHLLVGNLLNDDDLEKAFSARPEVVIHFAAYIEAGESVKDPAKFFLNNTVGTTRLATAAVRHGVSHFIFSSTAAVYGDPVSLPISETAATQPTNPYGTSKLAAELVLIDLAKCTEMSVTILRYFNACGADLDGLLGENHKPETHLIPNVLKAISEKQQSFSIMGGEYPTKDGTVIRDFIHVADLAEAHCMALEAVYSDGARCHVYNVGTGQGFTAKEIVEMCAQITNYPLEILTGPRRPGDPARLVADASKIQRELQWQPRYSDLETIIATAWRWHQRHS